MVFIISIDYDILFVALDDLDTNLLLSNGQFYSIIAGNNYNVGPKKSFSNTFCCLFHDF